MLIEDSRAAEDGTQSIVLEAQWLNDTELLFALWVAGDGNDLDWRLLDSSTGQIRDTASPSPVSPEAFPSSEPQTAFPQLHGQISPSGTFILHTKTSYSSSPHGDSTEVYLYNSLTKEDRLLAAEPAGALLDASWLADEAFVVFDLTREGASTSLYQAFPQSGEIISLTDRIGFEIAGSDQWSLSPNGELVAAIDNADQLNLVSIQGMTIAPISRPAMRPSFSHDGAWVYFYQGTSLEPESSDLVAYDRESGSIRTLVTPFDLAHAYLQQPSAVPPSAGADYAVSPNQRNVALRGGWLWVLQLCN